MGSVNSLEPSEWRVIEAGVSGLSITLRAEGSSNTTAQSSHENNAAGAVSYQMSAKTLKPERPTTSEPLALADS